MRYTCGYPHDTEIVVLCFENPDTITCSRIVTQLRNKKYDRKVNTGIIFKRKNMEYLPHNYMYGKSAIVRLNTSNMLKVKKYIINVKKQYFNIKKFQRN